MSELTLSVERREPEGKNANRRLRGAGKIPAVVYGAGKDSLAIQVDRRTMLDLLKEGGGENMVFLLQLAGTKSKRHTMIKEMDVDPITRRIQHIDFQRVLMDEKVKVQVQIELLGVPDGVKNEGGVLDFITREVEIESLPADIPQLLQLDVSALHIGDHLQASVLEFPAGVELMDDAERVIVSVSHARVVEEEEVEEEELLEAEAEEPEVIGRGKEEEEEVE